LVIIHKEIFDKKTRTTVSLSKHGISDLADYWKTMDAIRAHMAREKKQRTGGTAPHPGLSPEPAT